MDLINLDTKPEYTFGPTGEVVYDRTYSRTKPDGTKETWPETVERVCIGNLSLTYGPRGAWSKAVEDEFARLRQYMLRFAIIPAGRHLWASGVKGRQYLFNCHVSGWGEKLSDHFEFTFLRLMEGGGVGANYSSRFLSAFGAPRRKLRVHVVCDPMHQDYAEMDADGLLSTEYDSDWAGSFNVEDSREGWSAALVDLIDTFMTDDEVTHENRVYDVSRVRCKGSRLKTFGGVASGPGPFARMMHEVATVMTRAYHDDDWSRNRLSPLDAMEIDHAIAECVVSGGNRRSARMAIVHWADPHIFEFLACKRDTGKHWTTNISVEIDDEFVDALNYAGRSTSGQTHTAEEVHRRVVEGMLLNGEPGYWNSSLSSRGEVGEVIATNPCLTGDTVIATVAGPRTFANLAESGEDVEVYSWHPKTKLPVVRWMRRPHMTARNAEILKVTFDSGLTVRCTPNHGFYSFRGKKIEARNLQAGQSIRAFSASRDSSNHERIHAWDSKRNAVARQWTHRMVWENANGPVPDGMVVAHLDGDATNSALGNLQPMTPYDHASYDYPKRALAGFNGHCPNHKVVSVEADGFANVYNGMVEDSHTYIVLDADPVAGHMSGIVSANCGEIALQPWENCNLGHINLDAFAPTHRGGPVDWLGLDEAHRLMTRFLVRATYGDVNDQKQADKLARNRRIGVGHLGVQGFYAKRGYPYAAVPGVIRLRRELGEMKAKVREAAREAAFELRIPEPVKVTTVAPTGTIAKLPGVGEGIHPVMFRYFIRRVRFNSTSPDERAKIREFREWGFKIETCVYDKSGNTIVVEFPTKDNLLAEVEALGYDEHDAADLVQTAGEISMDDMLAFQAMYQECYADNAVSFTVNVKPGLDLQEVAGTIAKWLPRLKGTTVMTNGSRPQAPYEEITAEQYAAAEATIVSDSIDEECATGACPVR